MRIASGKSLISSIVPWSSSATLCEHTVLTGVITSIIPEFCFSAAPCGITIVGSNHMLPGAHICTSAALHEVNLDKPHQRLRLGRLNFQDTQQFLYDCKSHRHAPNIGGSRINFLRGRVKVTWLFTNIIGTTLTCEHRRKCRHHPSSLSAPFDLFIHTTQALAHTASRPCTHHLKLSHVPPQSSMHATQALAHAALHPCAPPHLFQRCLKLLSAPSHPPCTHSTSACAPSNTPIVVLHL